MNILLCERLNEANEYTELLASAYNKKKYNVIFDVQNFLYSDFLPSFLHILWPEAIYKWRHILPQNTESLNFIEKRLQFYLQNKIPIVYTVHNFLPHTAISDFDKKIYALIIKYANIIVHHGDASIILLKNKYPECDQKKHIVSPHGPYPSCVKNSEKERQKYLLSYAKYIYLNFGRQRENKGYNFTKTVFNKLADKSICLFTIGPKHNENLKEGLFKKAMIFLKKEVAIQTNHFFSSISRSSKTFFRNFKHNETPHIIAASDVFFLGHQEGLNSGIVSLAASYGKPVIFPDLGNFKEQLNGWPWFEMYEPRNINSAIEAVKRMQERISEHKPGTLVFDNSKWLQLNSWNIHVNNIINAVEELKRI